MKTSSPLHLHHLEAKSSTPTQPDHLETKYNVKPSMVSLVSVTSVLQDVARAKIGGAKMEDVAMETESKDDAAMATIVGSGGNGQVDRKNLLEVKSRKRQRKRPRSSAPSATPRFRRRKNSFGEF